MDNECIVCKSEGRSWLQNLRRGCVVCAVVWMGRGPATSGI